MKKILIFWSVTILNMSAVFSQITIDQLDMPSSGDTLRVSLTTLVPQGYASTAMDTTWNFSMLQPMSQQVDTFVSATSTPVGYQLFFVLLGGANLASPRSAIPIPGIPVTQGFTFFKNSQSSFSDLGSAYTIQGIPVPAKYDVPDKLYQFPLIPGTQWSSSSSFAVTVPGLAFYSTQRTRWSVVDGWGNLVTPFGTFQALRVKSTLTVHDSIYIDSLGTGFPLNRNITEYKWLAKEQGIPVLQVNEEQGIATARYRDIYRMPPEGLAVTLGPDTAVYKGTVLTMHAKISGGSPPYQILWNTLDTGSTLTVTVQDIQTYSVFVMDAAQRTGMAEKTVSIRYPQAVDDLPTAQLVIRPNPGYGMVHLTLPEICRHALISIMDLQGNIIRTYKDFPSGNDLTTDLSDLPEGPYIIRIATPETLYTTKYFQLKQSGK